MAVHDPNRLFGRIVRYVTERDELVSGIITAVSGDKTVNLHLFPDGVYQAHLPQHVYDVPFAPVDPTGHAPRNTWHPFPANA